jgi:hypothetical protein
MSLRLPDLDDRTYEDLLAEARALIPGLYPDWTNHNPTDPGITLIELFAWLTEMLIYRTNRLPKENVITFLRLLNGPAWQAGADLDEDIRATVADLRRRHRTVTRDDYELLSLEAAPGVARARCVPLRDLAAATEPEREAPRAAQVSVILVPDPLVEEAVDPDSPLGAPLPSDTLLKAVADYLEPRRLLTVHNSVVGPVYAPVQAEIVVARRADTPEEAVRARVLAALGGFLDPLTGGPEGRGWPFGRDVYVSELYQLLEKIPGVDFVPDLQLASVCPDGAKRCIPARELWHDRGDFIGLGLSAHHLPWALVADTGLFVAPAAAFVPVEVRAAVTRGESEDLTSEEVRRVAREKLRSLFHPLHQGADGESAWEITQAQVEAALLGLKEVSEMRSLDLITDPAHRFQQGNTVGIRLKAGEVADLTASVESN